MPKVKETCEKFNCTLDPNHDGWHVKKAAKGKVVISWLNGEWKSADGHGTYRYQDPPGHGYLNSEPMFDSDPRLQNAPNTGGNAVDPDYSPRYDPTAPEYGEAD